MAHEVEFDEPGSPAQRPGFTQGFSMGNVPRDEEKGMAAFFVRRGFARSEHIANIILVCVSIFFFILSFIIYTVLSKSS